MPMSRCAIIESSVSQWQRGNGDLIAFVNLALVDAGEPQLNCCERADVFSNHEAACSR